MNKWSRKLCNLGILTDLLNSNKHSSSWSIHVICSKLVTNRLSPRPSTNKYVSQLITWTNKISYNFSWKNLISHKVTTNGRYSLCVFHISFVELYFTELIFFETYYQIVSIDICGWLYILCNLLLEVYVNRVTFNNYCRIYTHKIKAKLICT